MERHTRFSPLKAGLFAWCAAAALIQAAPARAQTQAVAASATTFAIESQPLDTALIEFARVADVQVLYSPDMVAGKPAPRVNGAMAPEDALNLLLAGSGLRVTRIDDRTFALEATERHADTRDEAEIIVTAQRREERGQDVPISVTGFGANAIDNYRLETLRDVSRVTPGLLVSAFSQTSPTIAIRAANNTFTQIGANKPVAVVLDDVFIPRNSAASFELFGLNSIQVLKGPQGTLFGRNVTGGAILIDTGRPSFDETEARLRLTLGDYEAQTYEGLADFALSDAAAFRVAGSYRVHSGYGEDRLTGNEEDDLRSGSVRAQGRFALTPNLEMLVGGDYSDDRNGGRTLSSIAAGDDGDPRTSELGVDQGFARTQWGASVRLFADIWGGELTSITAYRRSQTGEIFSNVGANFSFLTGTQSQLISTDSDEVGAFSQEVRYASPLWRRGNFVVGFYYADEDASRLLETEALAAITGATVTHQFADQSVESQTAAVFADGTFNITDQLSFTLGARYTEDSKTASLIRTDALNPANNFSGLGLESDWSEVTPRAILTWRPTDNIMAYLSYARGYTAGGYNTEAATLEALNAPFDPETLDNYELGLRSEWFDNRFRFNISLFNMDYEDKQELYFNNVTRVLNITNAAKATIDGVEIEARLLPTDWLTLNASYATLDSEYQDFVIPGGAVNTGNPLGSSPEEKYSFSADVRAPLGGWGEAFGTIVYYRTADYFTGATADPNLHINAYDLINLSAGVEPANGRWRLTAFVRNLQDTDYLLTPSTQVVLAEYLGEPRTFGVSLDVRF